MVIEEAVVARGVQETAAPRTKPPPRPMTPLGPSLKHAPQLTPHSLAGFAAPDAGKVVGHHVEGLPRPPSSSKRPGSGAVHHHHVDADARNRMLIQVCSHS